MSALKSYLASLQNSEILLPKIREWLAVQAARGRADRRIVANGIKHDASLSIETFARRRDEYDHHGDNEFGDYFHPSRIGGCPRAAAFGAFGVTMVGNESGAELTRMHFTFEVGTYFHVLFQNLCSRAGLLLRREVQVRDDENKIIGHCDGVLRLPKAGNPLLEIKTISPNQFPGLKAPKPEHIEQAQLYMHALKKRAVVFVYYNKGSSELKEYTVAYSAALVKVLIARINDQRSNIASKVLPSRDGRTPYHMQCKYCSFSPLCFSSSKLEKFLKDKKVKDLDTSVMSFNLK